MKYILATTLLFLCHFAQAQTTVLPPHFYAQEWHDIDSLLLTGETKKADALLNELQEKAKKEKNTAQIVKTLLFKVVQTPNTEGGYATALRSLQEATDAAEYPEKPILQSMLGEIYIQYLRQNYYHKPLKDTILPKGDIRLLSSNAILILAKKLLVASYSDVRTQSLKIDILDALTKPNLVSEDTSRPTVFDFLAHRALSVLDKIPSELREQAMISLDSTALVCDAETFLRLPSPTSDSLNRDFMKRDILKKLIAFHKNDADKTALVEAELLRTDFVANYSMRHYTQHFYQKALESIFQVYKNDPSVMPIAVKLSELYEKLGDGYANSYSYFIDYYSIDPSKRFYRKKAMDICQEYMDLYPNSPYFSELEARSKRLKTTHFQLKIEEVNTPNVPILSQLTYRNMDTLYGRWLYLPTYANARYPTQNDTLKWAFCQKLSVFRSFKQILPHFDDFQPHTVEIILDSLPLGSYILLLSNTPDFEDNFKQTAQNTQRGLTQILRTSVSNISPFYTPENQKIIVVNRTTGEPMKGVKMQVGDTISDSNHQGIIRKNNDDDVVFSFQKDTLIWDDDSRYRDDDEDTVTPIHVQFFTDRNIYRPAQKIHFKGIVVKENTKNRQKSKLWTQQRMKIGLFKEGDYVSDLDDFKDALDTLTLTTNEFGSFAGTFTAPTNGNLGEFKIIAYPFSDDEKELEKWEDSIEFRDRDAFTTIRVEEYKRPRFEVEFEPVTRSYKPDEWVTIKGFARSLANSNVDGAKVVYTILKRETWSPYGYHSNFSYETEADSIIETDAKGVFTIHFKADFENISDSLKYKKKYDFTIKATVTDLNGETHEAKTIVKVGSSAIDIILPPIKRIDRRTKAGIPLSINAPNGAFLSSFGSLKIEQLDDPTPKKSRYWYAVNDTFLYDSVYFHKQLPPFSFNTLPRENNDNQVVLKTIVYEKRVFDSISLKNGLFLPNIKRWAVGTYRLTFNVFDTGLGDTIQKMLVFDVFDYAENLAPNAADLSVFWDKKAFYKNEKITIHIHAPCDTASVYIEFFDNEMPLKSEWVKLSSRLLTYTFSHIKPIEGNLFYRVTMVKDNRIFSKTDKIPLVDDTKLNLNFTSFRDHLAPGQNEKWTIRITDTHGKPVSAELAATLYDAALDNLKDNPAHNWFNWDYFTTRNRRLEPVYENDFKAVSSSYANSKWSQNRFDFIPYKHSPRTWLWFSTFYDFEEEDVSLLNYLSNDKNKAENANDILRGIFYKDGKRYVSILTQLKADSNGVLKPVIIIGYGTMKKSEMTGAVSTVTSNDMTIISQGDLVNALQGKVAGVTVTGQPGAGAEIRVRGVSSLYEELAADKGGSSLAEVVVTGYGVAPKIPPSVKTPDLTQVKIRKNLSETVFFMPQLQTDFKGNVELSFTMNEALTRWKFMSFAHTKSLQSGILYIKVVTQKDLMVFPNMPRFLREGDEIELVTKVSNFKSGGMLNGFAGLNLFNAATEQPVDSLFLVSKAIVEWSAKANESAVLKWKIKVLEGTEVPALLWRIAAKSGDFSDGEQNIIPILPKQILLTQTIPLNIEGGKTDTFYFAQMDKPNLSNTLRNHRFNVNIIANPAWNLVTGLAYSMEYPHECSEQLFSRFYSNALAASVFERMPQLKAFLNQNERGASSTLPSELQRTLMEEAPQLLETNGVFDRKKLLKLFDLNRMSNEQKKDFDKLATRITPEGGLAWYPEGSASWFISQHVAAGLGHLKTLGVALPKDDATQKWVQNLVLFTDKQVVNYFAKSERVTRSHPLTNSDYEWYNGRNLAIQHAYMRSFYPQIPLDTLTKRCIDSTLKHIENDWQTMDLYQKALGALATNRFGKKEIARKIVAFLKKSAKIDVSGMHWGQRQGIYWYEMPVETQAILIEAFNEITHDSALVFLIKKHLLGEMDNHGRWSSTKATTEAIYALLLVGDETPNKTNQIKTNSPNKVLSKQIEKSVQTDNGFIQANVKGIDMDKNLAKTVVSNLNRTNITGSISWQFYENMDKVKAFNNVDSVVVLTKQMYKIDGANNYSRLVTGSTPLSIGDKLSIKLTIKTHKPLEYVHLKDMRPANCEPVDVVSERQWNCYKTTRDVSTNFFFDYIPVGEFTLTYDVTVQQRGDFASGVASLQCMYVPSVTAYTEGGRLIVR